VQYLTHILLGPNCSVFTPVCRGSLEWQGGVLIGRGVAIFLKAIQKYCASDLLRIVTSEPCHRSDVAQGKPQLLAVTGREAINILNPGICILLKGICGLQWR